MTLQTLISGEQKRWPEQDQHTPRLRETTAAATEFVTGQFHGTDGIDAGERERRLRADVELACENIERLYRRSMNAMTEAIRDKMDELLDELHAA